MINQNYTSNIEKEISKQYKKLRWKWIKKQSYNSILISIYVYTTIILAFNKQKKKSHNCLLKYMLTHDGQQ